MYLPKSDVYNSLKELPYFTAQTSPMIFTELPAVIFQVGNNSVKLDLDNNIAVQDMEIQIDIWAEDSVKASTVLAEVEEIMRSNLFTMSYSNDVPNVSRLYHTVCRFTKQI